MQHDDATKGWKDIGVGQLSIRSKEGTEKASKESTPTIVIRNDVCVLSCLFVVIKVHLSTGVLVLIFILLLHAKLEITTSILFSFDALEIDSLQNIPSISTFSKHLLLKPNENSHLKVFVIKNLLMLFPCNFFDDFVCISGQVSKV